MVSERRSWARSSVGKVTVGLTSHWLCAADSGIFTYGLSGLIKHPDYSSTPVSLNLDVTGTRDSLLLQVDVTAGKSMTFGEFHAAVEIAARHLLRLGCRRGDVVAIFCPNSFQWMMVATAALRIGAVFAAVNHLLKPGMALSSPSARAYSKRVLRTNCALRIKKCAPRISSGIYFLSTS